VARDRKRSRQRRSKPVREPAAAPPANRVVRADSPGSLDHTGEVDEFDAALVRGAGGTPAESGAAVEDAAAARASGSVEQPAAAVETVPSERAVREPEGDGAGEIALGGEAAVPVRRPRQPLGVRVGAFLRASWAELQRVQWPDRHQVSQATAVVIGFVAIMGAYFGVADWVAQKVVNFIL
jgi:preprotein translocase subunit SecE